MNSLVDTYSDLQLQYLKKIAFINTLRAGGFTAKAIKEE